MLFTTISSLITGARLDRVQRALDTLSETVARVRDLHETEALARPQSAAKQLDETWSQFEDSQRFTEGMKLEVVQARRDLNVLHHQFGHLVDRDIRKVSDAGTRVSDINVFFLSVESHGHPCRRAPLVSDAPGVRRTYGRGRGVRHDNRTLRLSGPRHGVGVPKGCLYVAGVVTQ